MPLLVGHTLRLLKRDQGAAEIIREIVGDANKIISLCLIPLSQTITYFYPQLLCRVVRQLNEKMPILTQFFIIHH
jgi:hypothetical protein